MKTVERKMSNTLDVHRLIAEVRERTPLWDIEHDLHRTRPRVSNLWQEVADKVGLNVHYCKRKWKNLRDAYRAEVKRAERRIEKDKVLGVYDPNTNYNSKWIYFPALSFLDDGKQSKNCSTQIVSWSPSEGNYNENLHNNIKVENRLDVDDGINLGDDDDDATNDMLFEEFENIVTPQGAERLSTALAMNNSLEGNSPVQLSFATPSTSKNCICKCSKNNDEQINFLQDLGREEQKLIRSTRQDITRYNKVDHIGDSDYNFLVSFLPNMKKMSELQNLQFRAKMCDMVLNILAPPVVRDDSTNNSFAKKDDSLQQQTTREETTAVIYSTTSNDFN